MKQLNQAILGEGLEDVYSLTSLVKQELEKDEGAKLLENEESVFPVLKINIKIVTDKEFKLVYEKDVLMEKIEKVIFKTMRKSDILIGNSNMEYTLLLINSDIEGGKIFINRLNSNIAKYNEMLKDIRFKISNKSISCRR